MSHLVIAAVVFGCSFGAALVGMALHVRLPVDHLDPDSRDVVKLVMGLIATMSALVLSLLLASANTAYDRQRSELQALAANIVLLDRTLELYGPEASAVRNGLREVVQRTHDRIWSPQGVRPEDLDSEATRDAVRVLFRDVHTLAPTTEVERMLQGHAIQASENMAQARLLMFAQLGGAISWAFLTALVFWITMLFLGFGLFARFHATVTLALLVGAVSVASAIFLILELNEPYHGLVRLSDEPLRNALAQIDQ